MKKIFFTVGPSQLYPTVAGHIKVALREDLPSISHRGKQFAGIFKHTTEVLRELFGVPEEYHIFFLGSATEGMERIIQNVVATHSFHIVNGAFSKKFFTMAGQLGKKATKREFPAGEGFAVDSIPIPAETECICLTQNETSSGFFFPEEDIALLKKKQERAFVALDVVSSIPYFTVDFSVSELTFFSVQKGFGMPAGLGVLIVSPAALEKAEKILKRGISIGSYHSFLSMLEYEKKYQVHETPNTLEIYLLGRICEDFLEKGIDVIRRETEEKAAMLYHYFDNHPKYKPLVKEPRFRSPTTLVIDTQGETARILATLEKKGFIVGSGYGGAKDTQMRIANFPSHTIDAVERLLREFERAG